MESSQWENWNDLFFHKVLFLTALYCQFRGVGQGMKQTYLYPIYFIGYLLPKLFCGMPWCFLWQIWPYMVLSGTKVCIRETSSKWYIVSHFVFKWRLKFLRTKTGIKEKKYFIFSYKNVLLSKEILIVIVNNVTCINKANNHWGTSHLK